MDFRIPPLDHDAQRTLNHWQKIDVVQIHDHLSVFVLQSRLAYPEEVIGRLCERLVCLARSQGPAVDARYVESPPGLVLHPSRPMRGKGSRLCGDPGSVRAKVLLQLDGIDVLVVLVCSRRDQS